MFLEQVRVQERQFHGIRHLLNFFGQPPDVFILHVRDFFEHQLFDFGFGDFFDDVAGPGVIEQVVSHAQRLVK